MMASAFIGRYRKRLAVLARADGEVQDPGEKLRIATLIAASAHPRRRFPAQSPPGHR